MDDKIRLLEAENEWLHEEIAEHQEYEQRLQDIIRGLQAQLSLMDAHLEEAWT